MDVLPGAVCVLEACGERERDADPQEHERPRRSIGRHEEEGERRIDDPGRALSQECDLELVPTRGQQAVPQDERDVASQDHDGREHGNAAGRKHEHGRRSDHQSVGQRVCDRPEPGLDVPAARQIAVELIRQRGRAKEDPCPPRCRVARFEVQPREDRYRREARDRERIRDRAAKLRPGHGKTDYFVPRRGRAAQLEAW